MPQPQDTQGAYRLLVGEEELRRTVADLADAVAADHPAGRPLVVIAVMKGALVFLADLIRRLPMPIEIELVNARSYQGEERREVRLLDGQGGPDLRGRRALLIDTVLDSGCTLDAVRRELESQRPEHLATCVLLSKRRRRLVDVRPDYVGMEIPDMFVVGYGLDHANRWRHLPYVAAPAQPGEDRHGE